MGDASALEELTPVIYQELHRLARLNMARERDQDLLQPSALVNEAFLRLIGSVPVDWDSRTQFFAFSSRLMRQILIDFARGRKSEKRGGPQRHIHISHIENLAANQAGFVDLIDLDTALKDLGTLNARQAQVVELRYFGGLSLEEIAQALDVSVMTVRRDLMMAEAWLRHEMQNG